MIITRNNINDGDMSLINKYSAYFKLDPNIIRLLFLRGYKTKEDISAFLSPSTGKFYDPYLLKDMDKVVVRIRQAIANKERITVIGDYDTDGISATAIMYKYFLSVGHMVNTFLPNRIADGYGLSFDTIDKVKSMYNPNLIITVDCGISAYEEIEYAKSLGIEVIVTDHHDIPQITPKCLIINPKMLGQKYPFKDLCGAGVALKVVQALTNIKTSLKYLSIASLATVADIVPLVDENRIITHYGIKHQKENFPLGIQKLIKKLRIDVPLTSTDISFKLAPKINATGRMGDPNIAFNLYIQEDPKEISKNISALLDLNEKRVNETNSIVDEAIEMLSNVNTSSLGVIIVKNEKWESGVLGIICSKLVDIYNKPACVLSMIDGELKGSLRSIPSINIYEALSAVDDTLVQFGGHNQAAGITLKPENYNLFCDKLNKYILSKYNQEDFLIEKKYDLDLSKMTLTDKFLKDLIVLEPFGLCNEKPLFKLTFNNVNVSPMPKFPNHIKAKVNNIELVGFNLGQYMYNFNTNSNKTIILELGIDKFGGTQKIKGIIKHISFSKLNTTVKSEFVSGTYINQLKYISFEKSNGGTLRILEEDKLFNFIEKVSNKSKFGTLVISNSTDSYTKFIEKNKYIDNYELYNINNKTGINTILFAPLQELNLNNYETVILLDPPIHIGYVNYLQSLNKNVIMANKQFDLKNLKNLDTNRAVFAKYHNVLKTYVSNQKCEEDIIALYAKIKKANPHFTNIKFNEFNFVILVLSELGICKVKGGNIEFTEIKSKLTESNIYNFISLLLNTIEGE